ncbi:MAG TPA: hypothetical protein PKC87_03285, partial [Candidatus Absconditabacterales bacterium]|nr:hypothetical protein [Candidatus Absconditabacterales bacterium]
MKFHILVFGCQMNYADSARIKAVLTNCGLLYTENIKEADIVIFDTCSIKQKAEDKITGKFKTIKQNQKIWITGCMIQHNMRNSKLKKEKTKLKIGNFMGSIKTKNPMVIGVSTEEINHMKSSEKTPEIVGINNIFNPIFHNLTQKRKNIELMRRIDDTGFLPLILKKIGYNISYDQTLIHEYEKIIPKNIST